MIAWKFLIFCAAMGAIAYLHFYFSHAQWRRVKGEQSSDVDPNYVKREDYFAQSFRSKVKRWLELPASTAADGGERTILKGHELIRVSPKLRLSDRTRCDDILVVEGDFACGTNCELSREIYAYGKAEVGSGSRMQAIAADQDLSIGDGTTVARWVDSAGELRIGRACVVHSRVTSQKAVLLGLGAEVLSVFAPEISSDGDGAPPHAYRPFIVQALSIPPLDEPGNGKWKKVGFDDTKLSPLGSDAWIYNGSLRLRIPLRLSTKLIVRGDCVCPPGSVLGQDLKATGQLAIGDGSECRGNLVAGKSVYLGPYVQFKGMIHAGAAVLLSHGVRGAAEGSLVAAHAGASLYVESGVTIRGKLSAAKQVRVVTSSFADKWRRRYDFDDSRA